MDFFEINKAKRIYEEIGQDEKKNLMRKSVFRFLYCILWPMLTLAFGFYYKSLNFYNSQIVFYVAIFLSVILFLAILFNIINNYLNIKNKDVIKLGEEKAKKSLLIKGNSTKLRKQLGINSIVLGTVALIIGLSCLFLLVKNNSILDPSSLSQEKTSSIKSVEDGDQRGESLEIYLVNESYHLVLKQPYSSYFEENRLKSELKEEKEITYRYIESDSEDEKTLVTFKTSVVSFSLDEALTVSKNYAQLNNVIVGGFISISILWLAIGVFYYFYSKAFLDKKAKYDSKELEKDDNSLLLNSHTDESNNPKPSLNYDFKMEQNYFHKGFSILLFLISVLGIAAGIWRIITAGKETSSTMALLLVFIFLFLISIPFLINAFMVKVLVKKDKLTIVNFFDFKHGTVQIINLTNIKSIEIKKSFKVLPLGSFILYDENHKVLGRISCLLNNQDKFMEVIKDLDIKIEQ